MKKLNYGIALLFAVVGIVVIGFTVAVYFLLNFDTVSRGDYYYLQRAFTFLFISQGIFFGVSILMSVLGSSVIMRAGIGGILGAYMGANVVMVPLAWVLQRAPRFYLVLHIAVIAFALIALAVFTFLGKAADGSNYELPTNKTNPDDLK